MKIVIVVADNINDAADGIAPVKQRCRTLYHLDAFGRERYGEAVELLMPVRYRAHAFGGSHAQRDIVHRTLIEAALRLSDRALARALVNERTSLKPHCPFGWRLHARAIA